MQEALRRPATREDLVAFWRECGVDPDHTLDHDASWTSGEGVRFRVNFHQHLGRLGVVLRRIRSQIPTLDSLGLPDKLLTTWLSHRSGLVLVVGPTGSGKSTTIASCLEWINATRSSHIVTIEDPVEYLFQDRSSFFTQREVGTDTDSFANGLRRAMRQAPDVIFVGEIRDHVTALTALQAAETGHLVFSTLHSPNVAETIDRIVNLVPPGERQGMLSLMSQQLIGIFCQRLLPGINEGEVALVCEHLDVQGAARDWLRAMDVPALGDLMRRGDNPNNVSFMRALVAAVKEGRVTHKTAKEFAPNATEFERAILGIS